MPGKANIGRGSAPLSENQCQLAGFTLPLGSQKDVAGTRQRRSSNDLRQNLLVRILSSRTFVTGSLVLQEHEAPAHRDDLPLTIVATAHYGREVPREDGAGRFERGRAVVRHAEEPRYHVPLSIE